MQARFLKRGENKIAYEVTGKGSLVIGVPGMGDVRGEYRFLAKQMADAGFTFASMDVRGHGESDAKWDDYSVGPIGSDIVALIRELNAPRALITGTSMGAGAALCAAAQAPELVAGVVLIGPFVRDMGSNPLMGALFQVMFADPWGAAMWGMYFKSLYPTHKPDDFQAYLAGLKKNLREPGRLHALRKMIAASKAASDAALSQVKLPALVLMGTRDPDFKNPEAEAKIVAARARGTYQMIQGAGHYPHAEMPQVTAPLVLNFANQVMEQTQHDTSRRLDPRTGSGNSYQTLGQDRAGTADAERVGGQIENSKAVAV